MSDSERLRLLQGQLEDGFRFVEQCAVRHSDMRTRAETSPDTEMAHMALAYLIHNLYTEFESYFLRVAKHFENNLDELRRFRHRFRNMYKSHLRSDRVLEVSDIAIAVSDQFSEDHTRFLEWVQSIIDAEGQDYSG
jgi:hypothetical protein